MKVLFNDIWIEIEIDRIESVFSYPEKSYIVENWLNIKQKIERLKKLKRLTN